MDTPSPPPPWKARPFPPKPAARRITRGVCWVVSLFWVVAWPLAVSIFGVWRYSSDQSPWTWASTVYPIAMLWLAYWLVAWFFWVPWGAIWAAATEAAPMPPGSSEPEPTLTPASELARS